MDASILLPTRALTEYTSVRGANWVMRDTDERVVLAIQQKFQIPEIVARVLVARGVGLEDVEHFLSPTVRNLLPNPFELLDMDKAANRLAEAVVKGEEIAIFGDYDVDGATSSSLLKRYFRELGSDPVLYIPDRMKEGYGPNTAALLGLKKSGVDVCVTVDCGTMSFEPLTAAKAAGLDVIVIDHHLGGETLPEAVAIVNPNRLDETSNQKHMAAVGVAFLLAVAVSACLRERGWFNNRKAPDLLQLLDIVALGTVCDVVPLLGANRAFVSQGLKIMRSRQNPGLAALADVARVDDLPSTHHLGFVMGPRINAGGRVGQADLGARLLSTEDSEEAKAIALRLDGFNHERRAIETTVLDHAIAQVEQADVESPMLFAVGQDWHPGVVGIVASRITERFHRPTAVISLKDGMGKASARSIAGIDLGSAIVAAKQEGLLVAGGGHAMAAGFTVEEKNIPVVHQFLCERFRNRMESCATRLIKMDGFLSLDAVQMDLIQLLKQVEPYGTANPEPRFVFTDVLVISAEVVGADHIKCLFGSAHTGATGKTVKAMAFRCLETPLGTTLLNYRGKVITLAARMKLNSWRGVDTVELVVDDVAV